MNHLQPGPVLWNICLELNTLSAQYWAPSIDHHKQNQWKTLIYNWAVESDRLTDIDSFNLINKSLWDFIDH